MDQSSSLPSLDDVNNTSEEGIFIITTTQGPQIPHYIDPKLLYIVTAVVAGLFILVPIFVRKGPNRGVILCCFWLTLISMWLFWATVYIAQMRPLMSPVLHNTSLAWMKHTWIVKPKPTTTPTTIEEVETTENTTTTDTTTTTTTTTTTEAPVQQRAAIEAYTIATETPEKKNGVPRSLAEVDYNPDEYY